MAKCLHPAVPALLLSLLIPGIATAHPGTGIAVDRQGRVYFTDLKRIWRWEPGGRVERCRGRKTQPCHPARRGREPSKESICPTSATQRGTSAAAGAPPDGGLTELGLRAERGFPLDPSRRPAGHPAEPVTLTRGTTGAMSRDPPPRLRRPEKTELLAGEAFTDTQRDERARGAIPRPDRSDRGRTGPAASTSRTWLAFGRLPPTGGSRHSRGAAGS